MGSSSLDDLTLINMVNKHADECRIAREKEAGNYIDEIDEIEQTMPKTPEKIDLHKIMNIALNIFLVLCCLMFVWVLISWINLASFKEGFTSSVLTWNFFQIFFS